MDPDPSYIGIGIGLCLLVLAFTSAVDAAFTSIGRHRLNAILAETDNTSRSRALSRLMNDPYGFKATIILLNASATIAATAFTLYLTRSFNIWVQVGYLGLLLLAILVMSEALPKAWAARDPDRAVLALAGLLNLITRLLWPVIAVVSLLSKPLAQLVRGQDVPLTPLVTEEEIRLLVNVGEEEGLIEHGEREMIEGIFSFGDTLVREIMVPRVDIVALEADTSLEKTLETIIEEGHSRIPVYEETIDTIVGILYAKDLFPILHNGQRDTLIRSLVRPAHFVPETMKVDALLKEMRQRKVHMAIVVDEYGGTAGLATIEDVLEEIVGEIQDEYDVEEPSIQILSDTEMIVDARVSIYDINEMTGLQLESADADRIGGLIYEQLGRVPKVGDEIVLDQATVTVLSVEGVRPQKLRITYQHPLELALDEERARDQDNLNAPRVDQEDKEVLSDMIMTPQPSGGINGKENTWNNLTTRT